MKISSHQPAIESPLPVAPVEPRVRVWIACAVACAALLAAVWLRSRRGLAVSVVVGATRYCKKRAR